MARDATDLRVRTKKFALRIIKLYQNLPHSGEAQVVDRNFCIIHQHIETK